MNPKLDQVIKSIENGVYGDAMIFEPLLNTLKTDYYLVNKDFQPYLDAIDNVDKAFMNKVTYVIYYLKSEWAKKSIIAAASMGKFSSDRSIQEYAKRIWNMKPLAVE